MDWGELGRDIQPWATIVGIAVGACSLYISSRSLGVTSRTNKAKFVFDLTDSFLKDPELRRFWYKLDYDSITENTWKFDLTTFRHSEDERMIDTLIYKFSVVGHMLKSGAINDNDIIGLYTECRQLFHNQQIREYIRFVQLDFYCTDGFTHLQFADGLYCYEMLTRASVKIRNMNKSELVDCLDFISEIRSIVNKPELRKAIAERIGYHLKDPPIRT